MPAEHIPGKPRVGDMVDYFNPRLMQRIGFVEGYGKRFDGPYAAIVTNNIGDGLSLVVLLPGVDPMLLDAVPHKEKAPSFTSSDGTNHPGTQGNGYWDWRNSSQAARAAKETKAAEEAKGEEK